MHSTFGGISLAHIVFLVLLAILMAFTSYTNDALVQFVNNGKQI